MKTNQIGQVRRFNRAVTRRVGALDASYLSRGRPLGEARLLFEIGMAGSIGDLLRHPRLNHRPQVLGGVLEEECGELLRGFFAERR